MRGKIFIAVLVAVVGLMGWVYVTTSYARTTPESTLEGMFTDVNAGALDDAMASFSEDAVARNNVRGETYAGPTEIRQMLMGMYRVGRRVEVVGTRTVGDQTVVVAEISDGGLVWGTEWFLVKLENGKIQYFELAALRLRF